MKVALVRPPFVSKQSGPPTGLAYLNAVLQEQGHSVSIIDLATAFDERAYNLNDYTRDFVLPHGHPTLVHGWSRLDEFCDRVLATSPDVVGFSLGYPTFEFGVAMARKIAAKVRCIAGGPHATFHPEALEELGCFSAVVSGYGEEAILEALEKDGVIELPLDSDREYLPNYRGFDMAAYGGTLSVLTSRGCPNDCSFCTQQLVYHRHSLASVVAQVRAVPPGWRLTFNDSNIIASEGRMIRLFQLLAAEENKPTSHVFGLQVKPRHAEYIPAMAAAGVREVRLGIESGSRRERDSMRKPRFDNDLVVEMVEELTRHGIITWTQFIFCYPDQTDEDRGETLELMRRINAACDDRLVRHFWYRFMVHHGLEEQFEQLYGVQTESPSIWRNDLYDPETVNTLHLTTRAAAPANTEFYV